MDGLMESEALSPNIMSLAGGVRLGTPRGWSLEDGLDSSLMARLDSGVSGARDFNGHGKKPNPNDDFV